jgi:TATA-box binding protein (TBP) (component of TFIID and TFIIIB)
MSLNLFENEDYEYENMDLKIINFIKMINNKENKIPEPSYFTISTQSAMCNINGTTNINLAKIVVHIAKNIIENVVMKKNPDYLIRGIVVDNLIIRFDESYLKKYKNPYIKYMGNVIDPNNDDECFFMANNIKILENNSLKKQGRQKKKKDNDNFYNSCSIIVKGNLKTKCVNIKLFNNGKITLTGAKAEIDGYNSTCVLLNEMKREPEIFLDIENQNNINNLKIDNLKIDNYKITMINSDFNTNFKIDLLKLLSILNNNEKDLFTKFNPEKYRGLIIGYYWNLNKPKQDGKCLCKLKCNGKGNGNGDGECKKITISVFKSGSVIITGGRLVKQIEDAYSTINEIFKENYHEINKLSILDFIDEEESTNYEEEEHHEKEEDKKIFIKPKKDERKIIKIKNILNK